MDLNVLPPEEDDYFKYVEEDNASHKSSHVFTQKNKNSIHVEHTETAVEIARREREERKQKLKRERNDDRPTHATKQATHDNDYQKSFRSYDESKLPSGWLECPPMGDAIYGFLPSKTPLGDDFKNCIPPGKRYSFKQVFTRARLMEKRIGMVINLTNTDRYYQTLELKKDGITYVKIPCRGRDSVPDNECVNSFVHEVSQFFSRQKKQQIQLRKHIFVHCTHGHNRTGFMIVHYLVRMKSYPVKEAIEIFAKARMPGIYKADYIEALYTFYHEIRRESLPQIPEWKRSSDLDLNSDAVPDDDNDDHDGTVPVQEDNHEISLVMTNDDVLGDNIPDDQQYALREFCYKMLMLPIGPKGVSQFPGSNPVSLDRDNIQLLRQRYYCATWKADGTRYMMLITFDGCYLIDRSFNFRRVQMRFPCRSTKEGGWNKTHHYTLLDGEMIIDKKQDSGKHERRYLIYDMMATNGHSIVQIPFSQRWELLKKEIIEPRNDERTTKDCLYRYDKELFRVRRKDFWPLSTVKKLLKELIPKLSHEADGLIFQCWDDQYISRTHQGLLKWKYADMNSVDFLFEIVDERWLIYCFERGKKKLIRGTVQFKGDIDPASCMGKIIECSLDSEKKVWKYMRTRRDKSTPNDINTYRKVLQSIDDNITGDVLMMEIDDVIGLPMYAERFKELTNKPVHQVHRDVGEGRS